MIRFVDAFAGIGGFRLGIEAACRKEGCDHKCVASIEIDKDARGVYGDNFGDAPLEDITKIDPSTLPDHDLLVGGFPCQVYSRNGKHYNKNNKAIPADDDRADLFKYLVGILAAKHPKAFVFENVKEILTIRRPDGHLAYEAVVSQAAAQGYVVKQEVLDSADFGVAQQRRRVYFVGVREDLPVFFEFPSPKASGKCVEDFLDGHVDGKYLLENCWKNRRLNGGCKDANGGIGGMLARLGQLKSSMPKYEAAFRRWLSEGRPNDVDRVLALRIAYDSREWERPARPVRKIMPVAILYGDTPSGLPRQQDKLYSRLGISPTLATFSTPAFDVSGGWRLLVPRECARLQGFPNKFRLHQRDVVAYKQIGNAVTTSVVGAVVGNLLPALGG